MPDNDKLENLEKRMTKDRHNLSFPKVKNPITDNIRRLASLIAGSAKGVVQNTQNEQTANERKAANNKAISLSSNTKQGNSSLI